MLHLTARDADLEQAVADVYLQHVASQSWGCVAMLACVAAIQQYRPDLSQSAAIRETMAIVHRVRRQA
jgi:hypothetical protein